MVCTSVEEDELCVNGMSFSKRQSKWANSALVASVDPRESFLGDETSSPKFLLLDSIRMETCLKSLPHGPFPRELHQSIHAK